MEVAAEAKYQLNELEIKKPYDSYEILFDEKRYEVIIPEYEHLNRRLEMVVYKYEENYYVASDGSDEPLIRGAFGTGPHATHDEAVKQMIKEYKSVLNLLENERTGRTCEVCIYNNPRDCVLRTGGVWQWRTCDEFARTCKELDLFIKD
jgi:hypothetical protein